MKINAKCEAGNYLNDPMFALLVLKQRVFSERRDEFVVKRTLGLLVSSTCVCVSEEMDFLEVLLEFPIVDECLFPFGD